MKKKILKFVSISLLILAFNLTSCKKEVNNDVDGNETTNVNTSTDESIVSDESNNATISADQALSGTIDGGRTEGLYLPYGFISADSVAYNGKQKYTLYYDSTSNVLFSGFKRRSGYITVTLTSGNKWKDQGAIATSDINLKVTNTITNKTTTIVGTHTIENITGGNFSEIKDKTSGLEHKITSNNMVITNEDGSTRNWSVARKRVAKIVSNELEISIDGLETQGGFSNVVIWGNNRDNNPFYTQITNTCVFKRCSNQNDKWRVVAGTRINNILGRRITSQFGVNANGTSLEKCASGAGILINWQYNNRTKSIFVPYL